ncbi:hypothetical protein C8Q70DRAFT_457848 [Cubamyces menziesii]|nr:hypothetical protein C8Q70DRAFT_457848 [Cubamyces menziesii]
MLTLRGAGIISTCLEGILYGYSILLFTLTMWILVRNRNRRRLNYGMLAASCALLVLSTAEMGVNIARVYQGFLTIGPGLPGGPEQYFADVSQPTFVTKSALYCLQTLILDGVVIMRTYVVWQSVYVVILPIIGYCGLLAATIGSNTALATASTHAGDIFATETGRWITAVYSLTLGTNLSSTLLLAYRIWQVTRESAKYRSGASGPLTPVLRAIIESGAIYSMAITAGLVTFLVQSNGVYIVLDILSPIISIVFNMIIVRIGLASDRRIVRAGPTTVTQLSSFAAAVPAEARARRRGTLDTSYELKDITVDITQFLETTSGFAQDDDPESTNLHTESHKSAPLGNTSVSIAGNHPSDDSTP